MLRSLLMVVVLALGALCIDPAWDGAKRTLSLRLRGSQEIASLVGRIGSELVTRATAVLDQEELRPAVASGPPDPERITEADRKRLDRLIEEKLRE